MKPQPGDYSYSGMHDSGPLPPPKEGGPMADLISYIHAAKGACDEYLTAIIEKEKAEIVTKEQEHDILTSADSEKQPDIKKARKDEFHG